MPTSIDLSKKRICVTGGHGFLGTYVVNNLQKLGALVYAPHQSLFDLRYERDIHDMLVSYVPDIVIHLAAHVGGIGLNRSKPAELFYDNAIMGIQLIDAAYKFGVEKFVQIGTICEYPLSPTVPFREEDLWQGYPEATNAPYGLAKKMLLVQGQAYRKQYGFNAIHLLPVNLYGPGDNFRLESSHVVPALIRKFVEAKETNKDGVEIWGTGIATREFLYVKDAADGIVAATMSYDKSDPVNIGSGWEVSISDLSLMIAKETNYEGDILFNSHKPDGQPRRCLDTTRAEKEFGFIAKTSLLEGLQKTISWYLNNRWVDYRGRA